MGIPICLLKTSLALWIDLGAQAMADLGAQRHQLGEIIKK
jgi:hypothetical protein